ncbi:MAG: pilus assembly protein MshD [Nitrosomonadales bacterium]|nr:MAG: pilus assembly protein MshD [Nitrosomonadales bacterium]
MSSRHQACRKINAQLGLTLIEMVIFIVVVSVGVTGILSVMNVTTQHSADPLVRKQAAALADSILEEILLKNYDDPDGVAVTEASRDLYDDVDDYNGKSNAVFTDLPGELAAYVIGIAVTDGTATLGVAAKKVTVTVSNGAETISMTGYRANY